MAEQRMRDFQQIPAGVMSMAALLCRISPLLGHESLRLPMKTALAAFRIVYVTVPSSD
jgi:hypothetical protein